MTLWIIWECTVCGYQHDYAIPPEECPACAAGIGSFAQF